MSTVQDLQRILYEMMAFGKPIQGPFDIGPATWDALLRECFPPDDRDEKDPDRQKKLRAASPGRFMGVEIHRTEGAKEGVFNPCFHMDEVLI